MSWVLNDPRSPLFRGARLARFSGQRGHAAGGRLTRFAARLDTARTAGVEAIVEPNNSLGDVNLMAFLGGAFSSQGGSGVYRAVQTQIGERLTVDLFPLPPGPYWRNYRGCLRGVAMPVIDLEWDGDIETARYRVYHSLVDTVDHADARRVAIYSYNDFVEVTNNTANGGEVTITGSDGNSTGTSHYEVTVNLAADVVTVQAENLDTSTIEPAVVSVGEKIRFGNGLYIEVPTDWGYAGDTIFDVQAGPRRSFRLQPSGEDEHWFKVAAERNDNAPEVPSHWEHFETIMPPGAVTAVDFTFVSSSSVQIEFTLPTESDIAGAYIRQSWPQAEGYEIPFPTPVAFVAGTSGQTKTHTLTGLVAGQYWVNIRAVDDSGTDDHSDLLYTFYLSATALAFGTISKPRSFTASPVGIGAIKFEVRTNGAEDQVGIYWDAGTGIIDTTTLWALLDSGDIISGEAGSATQKNRLYRKTISGIEGGTYQFLARTRVGGAEEKNEDVLAGVTIYSNPITIPYNLEITRVN